MVEEEDSHLFNIFDFAEQIGDWDMSINNSVNFLWANLTNETQQRQQQTNIIIPRGGPVQGIIGQALNDNGLLGLNFHSGIVYDQPTNQRHCWGLDGSGQQTAYQGDITKDITDEKCTIMHAEEEGEDTILAFASSKCNEQAIALCMTGIVKGDENVTVEKPAIELIFHSTSKKNRKKQKIIKKEKNVSKHKNHKTNNTKKGHKKKLEKNESKHKNHKTNNTKKGHKKKLKWAQKRSKRSAIVGYAGEGKRFANDCGLDMCLWVPPFVVGSSLFSSTALSSVLSPDSPQERYTIVDEINHIQSFDQFMKIYQRSYSSYEEQQYRQSVFLANLGRTSKPFHR